jgi:hypothetical protein
MKTSKRKPTRYVALPLSSYLIIELYQLIVIFAQVEEEYQQNILSKILDLAKRVPKISWKVTEAKLRRLARLYNLRENDPDKYENLDEDRTLTFLLHLSQAAFKDLHRIGGKKALKVLKQVNKVTDLKSNEHFVWAEKFTKKGRGATMLLHISDLDIFYARLFKSDLLGETETANIRRGALIVDFTEM